VPCRNVPMQCYSLNSSIGSPPTSPSDEDPAIKRRSGLLPKSMALRSVSLLTRCSLAGQKKVLEGADATGIRFGVWFHHSTAEVRLLSTPFYSARPSPGQVIGGDLHISFSY